MHFSNGVGICQICNASLRSEIEQPATCLHRGFEDLVQLFVIIKRKNLEIQTPVLVASVHNAMLIT